MENSTEAPQKTKTFLIETEYSKLPTEVDKIIKTILIIYLLGR